jgi:hypothetical protein
MLQNQVKSLDVCWLIETNESINQLIVYAHFFNFFAIFNIFCSTFGIYT